MQTESLLKALNALNALNTLNTLNAYRGVAETFALPTMVPQQFVRTVLRFESSQALYPMIEKFSPTQGWLCFQSAIQYVNPDETPFAKNAKVGLLLNAEFVNQSGVSLHVRQTGSTWAAACYAPYFGDAANLEIKAEAYWVDRVVFNAADPERGLVCYDRLWQQREIVGIVPVAARFVGFGANTASANQSQEHAA